MCSGGLFFRVPAGIRYAESIMNRFWCLSVVFGFGLLASQAAGRIPPLTTEQQIELDSADDDDRGWTEAAFRGLIENARIWSSGTTSNNAAAPDLDKLVNTPESFRGGLFELRGRIEQQHQLPPPYTDVLEWFVRDDSGTPMHVFVIDPKIATPGFDFSDGSRIVLTARFYKRTGETARSGASMRYAAFVGALPRPDVPPVHAQLMPLWFIAALLAGLLIIFGLLFIYVRRQRRSGRSPTRRSSKLPADLPAKNPNLPANPADALAELHKRSTLDVD